MKIGIYMEIVTSFEPPDKVAANIESMQQTMAMAFAGYVPEPGGVEIHSANVEWYRIDDGPVNYRGKPPS